MTEVCLPDNYSDRMFELEAALEYEITLDTIRLLNDHYRVII
jgi:hypothetical protein